MAKEIRLWFGGGRGRKLQEGGLGTLVDDEDFEWLSQWKWKLTQGHANIHVVRHAPLTIHRMHCSVAYMHREILIRHDESLLGKKFYVRHKNDDGIDNRKENLLVVMGGMALPAGATHIIGDRVHFNPHGHIPKVVRQMPLNVTGWPVARRKQVKATRKAVPDGQATHGRCWVVR